MKIISEYATADSTDTQRGEAVDAYDAQCTPTVSATSFTWNTADPEPCNTVSACAGMSPLEHLAELLQDPDWLATSLHSGSWDFWKGDEEDVYGPEDGRPL